MCLISTARDEEPTEKYVPTREVTYVTRTRDGEFSRSRERVPAGPPIAVPVQRTSYIASVPPSVIEHKRRDRSRSTSRVRNVYEYPPTTSAQSVVYAPSARSSRRGVYTTTRMVEAQPAVVQQVTAAPAVYVIEQSEVGSEKDERRERRKRREYQYQY